ncbi:hypothetical protein L1F30_02315 [Simiduia sp. 21SJ11W-1]|uniref:hypothetical protein n=1 Tax=Simiduia sp. 21SJ11W-1 TaxID=2909669 RepID=UPI00209F26D8|nr:hypothetical protein [Simiduia sp. 21SJ11W-1]UTA48390.1 hypothetical protein L1F30_02315 [Simiduia sp. 21SJ11W-1]
MTNTPWYKNPEMLVALSALFIGLLTAVISIYSRLCSRIRMAKTRDLSQFQRHRI